MRTSYTNCPILLRLVPRETCSQSDNDLTNALQNKDLQAQFVVQNYQDPFTWRLINLGPTVQSEAEEAVLRIQGILCLKDLPPITNRPRWAIVREKPKDVIKHKNQSKGHIQKYSSPTGCKTYRTRHPSFWQCHGRSNYHPNNVWSGAQGWAARKMASDQFRNTHSTRHIKLVFFFASL